jgi:hypothetical protein
MAEYRLRLSSREAPELRIDGYNVDAQTLPFGQIGRTTSTQALGCGTVSSQSFYSSGNGHEKIDGRQFFPQGNDIR